MLGSNPELLQLRLWLSDALTTRLDLIHTRIDLIHGHKLESTETRAFVWFSTLIFPFYKMLFLNLTWVCLFRGFFKCIFQSKEKYCFLSNSPVDGTVNSTKQKTRVFCQIDAQEFHLIKVGKHNSLEIFRSKICAIIKVALICNGESFWERRKGGEREESVEGKGERGRGLGKVWREGWEWTERK